MQIAMKVPETAERMTFDVSSAALLSRSASSFKQNNLFLDLPAIAYSDRSSDVIEPWKKGFSEASLRCPMVRKAAPDGTGHQRPDAPLAHRSDALQIQMAEGHLLSIRNGRMNPNCKHRPASAVLKRLSVDQPTQDRTVTVHVP